MEDNGRGGQTPVTRQDRIRRLEQELQQTTLAHQGSEESRLRMSQELDEAREELARLRQLQENGLPTQSPVGRSEEQGNQQGGGLQELTSLYESLGDARSLQGVSLRRPREFSGNELVGNPYALMHWYREVSCWSQCYAKDEAQQLVLALQTLGGTARILIDNTIMENKDNIKDVHQLFQSLKDTFQRRDPGPDAWGEFHRSRMRVGETVIEFLNRLTTLSFVINMSTDPTCEHVSKSDIANRLRAGLPRDLSSALEKHLSLIVVDLKQDPPKGPWEMAATVMRLEKTIERPIGPMAGRSWGSAERRIGGLSKKVITSVSAMPNSIRKDSLTPKRQHKSYFDLTPEMKETINAAQFSLKDKALGAALTAEEKTICLQNSLCMKCFRYGHDQRDCKAKSTIHASKN